MKARKLLAWFLCIATLMTFMPTTSLASGGSYSGGSGTEDDPYLISSADELVYMSEDLNYSAANRDKYFKLTKNIDMSGKEFTAIGNTGKLFQGTFDGDFHIIYNLNISASYQYSGLFGRINGATVKNLGLENVSVVSNRNDAAGLVANAVESTIENCYVIGSVTGNAGVGGIVASTHSGQTPTTIKNCYARVSLSVSSKRGDTAGISGWNYPASVKIENCYSACTGELRPIAGWSDGSPVANSQFVNTFFDKTLSPDFSTESGRADLGKTSDELKTQSTYTSWDFDTVWAIDSNKNGGYPYLSGFTPGLSGAPSSVSVKVTDTDGNPVEDAEVVIRSASGKETVLSHESGGVYSGTVTTADETYTVIINDDEKGSVSQSGSDAVSYTVEINSTAAETAAWLEAGNELYLGAIQVTADNAEDLISSYTGTGITGTAYFRVENGVPTLYMDGVTVNDGYKEKDTVSSLGDIYKIYGIYYKPVSEYKLTIKLSGENVIEPEIYTDETRESAWTYGIIANNSKCTNLTIEGSENASLKISSIQAAIRAYEGVSINGGEYTIATDNGEDEVSGQGIYATGTIEIDNATVNITARRNCGIEMRSYEPEDKTVIRNSNVTVVGDTTGNGIDGIQTFGDLFIENSIVDVKGDSVAIDICDGRTLNVSGENTVVKAKSVNPTVDENWEYRYSAILLYIEESYDYGMEAYVEKIPEITLNDGLAVTTPDAGRFDIADRRFKSVIDTDGSYAREVVIKTPTEHCVCGTEGCTSHTGTIKHIADNSLNLIEDIATNETTLTSGSYYLTDDLTLGNSKALAINGTVNICLNGKTLTGRFNIGAGAVLNICDCQGGGKLINSEGHVIAFMYNNGTANIYGGTLVTNEDNVIFDFKDTTGNVLNLYGGTVSTGTNYAAIGIRTLVVNLYGGKITATDANGIAVNSTGKVNLCGNTEISVPEGYAGIEARGPGVIDAKGYTGGNISILCTGPSEEHPGLSDGDTVVINVTDDTADKFTLSSRNSGYALKRARSDLVYTEVYTVTFVANGGSGTMASVSGIRGEYELPECAFTAPTGKKFKAWSVNETEYASGTKIDVSGNITAKAIWTNIEKTTVTVNETVQTFGYDSLAKSFTVNANVEAGFNVKYQKDGSDIASPTDAGAYDVIIERAGDDTYKAYSKTLTGGLVITPKDITGAAVGSFAKMTYNGSEQTPEATVTIDGFTATGEWSKVTNVADTTTFTANGNFDGTVTAESTGMLKADASVTAPTARENLVYNKAEQELITAGTAAGGTVEYSTDNKNWSTELPKGQNAGKYEVWYKVTGDSNHNDVAPVKISVSIAKASVTIPAVSGKVYNGSLQAAEIRDTEYYTVSENNGGTKSGRYDVKLALKDSANYFWEGKAEDVSEITVDFNISSAENEWTTEPSIAGWTYGGSANKPEYGAKFGDVKIEYKKAAEGENAYKETVPTDAGNYNVRLSVAATGDFDGLSKVLDFAIAKANVSVTAPTAKENLVYNKAEQELITAGTAAGGTVEYSTDNKNWSTELPKGQNAGKYEVWYKVTGDSNHNDVAPVKISVSIAKASVTIPAVSGKVYNGSLQAAEIRDTEYYTVSENNGGTKSGRYDVKLALKDSANYFWEGKAEDVSEITVDFNISSAENEWTTEPSIAGWTYGGSANAPVYGAKFGDVKIEYKKAAEGENAYKETVPTDADNYNVRLRVAATKNFGELSKVLDFTIAKANVSVTAPTAKKDLVYNTAEQELITAGTAAGGTVEYSTDNKNWSTELPKGQNAGDYEVWYKVTGDSNHNDTAPAKISVSIARAQQSAPEAPAAVNETVKGKADGKITGVDSSMEYKADGAGEYTAVTGNEIANLAAGKYLVRYKEKDNYFAGSDKTVEIAAGAMITAAFDSNGGTAVESKTCEYSQTISAPDEPTKDGYEFVGWFADSGLTTGWNFDTDKLTENKTLYAKWVQGTVSKEEGNIDEVTADGLNDIAKAEKTDISLAVQVQENSKDDVIQTAIRDITDAPANFSFYDISLNKSTGGTVSEASSVIEIKLPYDFTRKQNIKVYRYHNGNVLELEQLAERNAVKPYEDGKCFADTANSCIYIYSSKFSTYSVAYDTVSSSGSGRGTSRYTVSFETNGGSKVSNQTVTRNSVMKEPTAPTKENFDFDGWYSDKELKTKYDFSAKVTKSFTLYAKWTEKDASENQFILTIGKKDAQVWGKTVANDVAPQIVKDRTMLPARFVAENLGAKVEWDGEKQLVTITGKNLQTGKDVTILITIGSDTATVNGENVKLDSPSFIENDRTYTPVRFISEELGASVEWDEATQQVIITKALASEEK